MNVCIALAVVSAATASPSPASVAEWKAVAVDDAILRSVTGLAVAGTTLSGIVNDQGTVQAQSIGEDLRTSLVVWFVDGNLQ